MHTPILRMPSSRVLGLGYICLYDINILFNRALNCFRPGSIRKTPYICFSIVFFAIVIRVYNSIHDGFFRGD